MPRDRPTRVLILGGAGFLGSSLARALAAEGLDVTALDRPGAAWGNLEGIQGRITDLKCDMGDPQSYAAALGDAGVVFHAAGATLPAASNRDPLSDLQSNVVPTLRLLEALKDHRGRRLVFISSGGTVYGTPLRTPIDEEHPTNPVCAYGIHKLAIEKYLLLYRHLHGLDVRIARLANPYGPRQNPASGQGAVTAFLQRIREGRSIEVWGDGSVVRDFFYVSDAVRGLRALMEYQGAHRIFNIGSGTGHSIAQLISAISTTLGNAPEVIHAPGRNADVPFNVLDITQARRELGWEPCIPLEEGIRLTWQGLQTH